MICSMLKEPLIWLISFVDSLTWITHERVRQFDWIYWARWCIECNLTILLLHDFYYTTPITMKTLIRTWRRKKNWKTLCESAALLFRFSRTSSHHHEGHHRTLGNLGLHLDTLGGRRPQGAGTVEEDLLHHTTLDFVSPALALQAGVNVSRGGAVALLDGGGHHGSEGCVSLGEVFDDGGLV